MLIAFCMLSAVTLYSQQIDSLENLIRRKNLTDVERVDALNVLSRDLTFANPIRSARLASEAIQTSFKINYPAGQAHGYRILASVFSTNNNIIIANEYLQKSMRIFQRINDSAGIANCYITMGHIFRRSKMRTEEIEYHKKSFELFSRLKIPARIAVAANNLGESYFLTKQFQKSRELTQIAIHLNDSLQNLSVLSNCYKIMGMLEAEAGDLSGAELNFKKTLEISDKLGDNSQKIATVETLIALADIYRRTGRANLELSTLKTAASFSEKNLLEDYLKKIYGGLIIMYANQNDQVLKYAAEYDKASDVVAANLLKNKIELNEYGVEIYEFLENENLKLETGYIAQAHRIKNKNFFLAVSLVSGLLFAIMAIILQRLLRKQKKAEKEIKEKTEQLRELAAHLQDIREKERTAIAGEIHEELGQQLTVIKMDLSWLKGKLEKTDETTMKKATELNGIIDNTINSVRRISTSLRPGILDDIGLPVAIKWQLKEFEKKYAIKSVFKEDDNDDLFLSEPVKTGLFRILQEALVNIGQNANAKNVTIELFGNNKEVSLIIEDDGIGFNSTDINSTKNIDFLEMKERCYMINGSFDIRSSKGNGTTITVKIPVE